MKDKNDDLDQYRKAYTGDLTSYAAMYGDTFSNQINLLGQLIHDKHHPSLGVFKEKLLRNAIEKFLPSRYTVGTGFVIFPDLGIEIIEDNKFMRNHLISNQLDIIIYDSLEFAPIFKDEDFVVLRPESVHAIIEVKGSLDNKQLNECLDKFADYSEKWMSIRSYYLGLSKYVSFPKVPEPKFFIMAWMKSIRPNGTPRTNGKQTRKKIVEFYKKKYFDSWNLAPHLDSLFIYNDCIVEARHWNDGMGLSGYGYYTTQGKYQKSSASGESNIIGDKTIGTLLNKVHASLNMSQNPAFEFKDKVYNDKTEEHEHEGFEYWLSSEEALKKLNF